MKKSASQWKEIVRASTDCAEEQLRKRNVPVVRGGFRGDHATVIEVEVLELDSLARLLTAGSLCVIDLRRPPYPLEHDLDLFDLHVYVRLGMSGTWLHYTVETPEDESEDEVPEDEIDYSWNRANAVPEETLDELAIGIASSDGFGSLRNKGERMDCARSLLQDLTEPKLVDSDFYDIGSRADTFYRTGVAPRTAKALESQGKDIADIARAMGISRTRVESALETSVPTHIARLLDKSGRSP